MIPEKKDLPGAKSGRSFFFVQLMMPLSLSRGEEAAGGHDEGGEERVGVRCSPRKRTESSAPMNGARA